MEQTADSPRRTLEVIQLLWAIQPVLQLELWPTSRFDTGSALVSTQAARLMTHHQFPKDWSTTGRPQRQNAAVRGGSPA